MRWVLLAALLVTGSARAAGLLAPNDQTLPPLRVTDHIVDVSVHDQVALTEVTQTFHNDTGRRLEATYVFPLPENADLTDFQMTFNGKMMKGEVLPADEARRVYENIVRRTKDPGLIEFIGRRLLQMRVFPIEPGSDTTIKMRYQQITRPISGMHGYHYPLRTRKTVGQAYGMVRFTVSLDTMAPLKNIWSPSHAVGIVRQGERVARIEYEASGGSLEDDFLLLYDTDASDLGLSVIAYRPDGSKPGHFALMLSPKQLWPETSYLPQDVVFVIDTSGSMSGEKIQQARRALQFCIDQLNERDRFNVVRFSTGFDVVFPELVPATKENRGQAQDFAGRFTAAGGTNIADTLHHVLGLRPAKGAGDQAARPFVVVFLTDGQGNREHDEIMKRLAEVPDAARLVRIFPFGVGHDVNTILLDRLAGDYTGRTTYVQPGENLELVLGDFFSVVSRPVLTNLRITLPGIGATEQFPATLGDLYHGQQIIIAGRFNTTSTGPVKLTAVRDGEPLEYVWPDVSFTNTAEASYVPAVWAGRKISYLIDQIRAHGESQEMIAEIVQLSQTYGIQTPYTSWLVAPEEEQRIALGRRWGRRPPPGDPNLPPAARRSVRQSGLPTGGMRGGPRDSPGKGGGTGFGNSLGDSITLDLDVSKLPIQKIGGRWYHRIGAFLVDEDVNEKTRIVNVKFGSDAYFGLIQGRRDLREALAASRNVIVMVSADTALLVADDEGIEEFSPEQKEQFGLARG
jgi:Ca-activated chloride channel family protein